MTLRGGREVRVQPTGARSCVPGRDPRIAIVGAGISGLVAAHRVRRLLGERATITMWEAGPLAGGSLRGAGVAGVPIDIGAEAFLARRPEVPRLLAELELAGEQVSPSGLRPVIWSGAAAHPLPSGTLMGIPAKAESLAGLVSARTLERIAAEPSAPLEWDTHGDTDIGSFVASRFGPEVLSASVDPLLGGVYAGLSSGIGVRAGLPTLAAALDAGAPSLSAAVSAALPAPQAGPVFGAIRGGYPRLVRALLESAKPVVLYGSAVTGLRPTPGGWLVRSRAGADTCVDAVVVAAPATQVARLLAGPAPVAAELAAGIQLASSVLVALAFPREVELPPHSGILVATSEPLRVKAFTLSSRKWPHLAAHRIVRASLGRFGGEPMHLLPDSELIAAARADFATVTGIAVPPLDAAVQRWPAALPQYGPGHLALVAEIEKEIAGLPGLELAGSYLRGVGVGACVGAAEAAAVRIAGHVRR